MKFQQPVFEEVKDPTVSSFPVICIYVYIRLPGMTCLYKKTKHIWLMTFLRSLQLLYKQPQFGCMKSLTDLLIPHSFEEHIYDFFSFHLMSRWQI